MLATIKSGYMVIINFTNEPYTSIKCYSSINDAIRDCVDAESLTNFRNWQILLYNEVASNILHK